MKLIFILRGMHRVSWILVLVAVGIIVAEQYQPKQIESPKGTIQLNKSVFEELYYANIIVGTPPQVQRAVIDTELDASIFIYSGSCPSTGSINCLNYEDSQTSEPTGETIDNFCAIIEDQIGFVDLNYTTAFRYCLANYSPRSFGSLQGVDSFLGIGYMSIEERDQFEYWMNLVPPEWPSIYGLSLRGSNQSVLHLGGYDHGEELIWSEKQTNIDDEDPLYIEAPLYRISICGEQLLPTQAFTVAQFSTSHNCLGLSQDLFTHVLSWLDFCYEASSKNLADGEIICVVDNEEQLDHLPWLTFKLSEDGEPLSLPLSSLITYVVTIQEDGTQKTLNYEASMCIIHAKDASYHDGLKIIFGILPMESFYIAVNAEEFRVGMYSNHQRNVTLDLTANCPPTKSCQGEQTYEPSKNICKDPVCPYFQYVDDDSKTCRISIIFIVITSFVLIIVSLIDFCAVESRFRLGALIRRNGSRS